MATKTLTKPKRKQSSQTRSWENLTDRRKPDDCRFSCS